MSDPVMVLVIAASLLTALSFVLARLVPDHYDRTDPRMVMALQPARRTVR